MNHNDLRISSLLDDRLSFEGYTNVPQYMLDDKGMTMAFFISDGCDSEYLSKEDCEKLLAAAQKKGRDNHAKVVTKALEDWPEEPVRPFLESVLVQVIG